MLPDKATFSDYGGEKQDYAAPEDPTTDRSAAEMNPAFCDVAAMTRMIPRAMVEFYYSGGVATIVDHDAVWGNSDSVKPTVTRLSAGRYRVEFPATVVDALGDTYSVNLKRGWANTEDGAVGLVASATWVTPTRFVVACINVNGTYSDSGLRVQLWVI